MNKHEVLKKSKDVSSGLKKSEYFGVVHIFLHTHTHTHPHPHTHPYTHTHTHPHTHPHTHLHTQEPIVLDK